MDIIANEGSGKGNGKICLDAIRSALDERMIPYTVHLTEAKGHAMQLARDICAACEPGNTVVALGGDGTFHEVLNGMDFEKARMGLVPAGRGNDFAIGTGAASLDPKLAISDIIRSEPVDLDYIQVSDKRCLNVAGTGLDVEVLERTARSHNKLTYIASLAKCLVSFKPYNVTVHVNGESNDYSCIMAGVCNGTQFGAGIKLSPVSVANDGKLDIIIMVKPKGVPTLLIMPKFVKGKHMGKPYTHHFICDSVQIDTTAKVELDGEIYEGLKFDAHVVKGGFKTFISTPPEPKKKK